MKKKTFFSQIIMLFVVAVICIVLTVSVALLLGSFGETIFDLSDLNLANMIPVLIIGGFISCVAIALVVMFMAKDALLKVKDYFNESKDDGGSK